MTKIQEAKLNMYNAVIAFLEATVAITAAIPAIATVLTAFKAIRAAIVATVQLEEQVISGITTNKSNLKITLCESAATIAAALFAYADSINDEVLKAKAKYTFRSLMRLRDDGLQPVVQNLHDDANAVIASLPPFGITAAVLTSFQNQITNYNSNVAGPRNAVAQRKAYKEQLRVLYKEADAILKNQLDKLALQLKATEPEWYNTYINNRIIIDPGTQHTQAAGTITDSITLAGIYGVIITVLGQTFTTTSNLDGSYNIKIPVPGIYTLIYTKAGYNIVQIINVEVKLGETTIVNVTLIIIP